MSLMWSSSLIAPSPWIKHFDTHHLKSKKVPLNPCAVATHSKFLCIITKDVQPCRVKPFVLSNSFKNRVQASHQSFTETNTISLDWEDLGDVEDTGFPWEGAVVYKRKPSETHVEYCTTLERLGLGKLSTEFSKSKASVMGLRVTKAVKDYPQGTPVMISIDVVRKKQKLRLDGILRTVIALGCNRCGDPAAESIFANFSLLLTEEPIEEPDIIDVGQSFGKETFKSFSLSNDDEDEDDDSWIDWDDRLYFPPEVKEIDISKHIRDLVHLEITINAVCDPKCKGICLKCGTNLNNKSCNCSGEEVRETGYGPLGDLKKQMQQKKV